MAVFFTLQLVAYMVGLGYFLHRAFKASVQA